jgi:hypothetical protein
VRAARPTRCPGCHPMHPGWHPMHRLPPHVPRRSPYVPRLQPRVRRRALRDELGRASTERRVLAAELGRLDETWEGISREGLRASFARLAVDAEAQVAAAAHAARGGTGGALSGWGGAEAEVERRCAARGDGCNPMRPGCNPVHLGCNPVYSGLQPHASGPGCNPMRPGAPSRRSCCNSSRPTRLRWVSSRAGVLRRRRGGTIPSPARRAPNPEPRARAQPEPQPQASASA